MQSNFTDLSHPHENQYFSPKRTLLFAVAIMVFAFMGIAFIQIIERRTNANVTNYEECIKARGSTILESYPAICVSVSDKRFIQPLSEVDKRFLISPTPTAEPTPEVEITFTLPAGWTRIRPDSSFESSDEDERAIEFAKVQETRQYPIGRLTVQYSKTQELVLPKSGFQTKKITLNGTAYEVLESAQSGGGIDSFSTDAYVGRSVDGTHYIRAFVRYQNDIDEKVQQQIISSLQFATPSPSPSTEN
jgi:hypothetical protein